MSIVVQMPAANEQRERRIHLREVREEPTARSVGTVLRDRRFEQGLDEAAVASKLKMRADQLRAIECDDFARLPGPTYAIGFIRAYAKFLGLDSQALIESYREQTNAQQISKPVELVFPEVNVERQWPNGGVLVVALVVAVVIYGIAQITMPSRDSAVTSAQASSTVVVVEPEAVKGVASITPARPHVEIKTLTGANSPILSVIGDETAVTTLLIQSLSEMATPIANGFVLVPPAATESAASISRITLKALEATYVQVKDPALRRSKAILLARVLNPGESFHAPDRSGLVLLTGNAGGIQVEVDGRSVGVLGKSGQVIKRLPLEPAYFLSRIDTSR